MPSPIIIDRQKFDEPMSVAENSKDAMSRARKKLDAVEDYSVSYLDSLIKRLAVNASSSDA